MVYDGQCSDHGEVERLVSNLCDVVHAYMDGNFTIIYFPLMKILVRYLFLTFHLDMLLMIRSKYVVPISLKKAK